MSKFLSVLFAIWFAPKLFRAFYWFWVILAILMIGAFSWGRSMLNAMGIDGSNFLLFVWLAALVMLAIVVTNRWLEYVKQQPLASTKKTAKKDETATDRETSDYAVRMKQYRIEADNFLESRKKSK